MASSSLSHPDPLHFPRVVSEELLCKIEQSVESGQSSWMKFSFPSVPLKLVFGFVHSIIAFILCVWGGVIFVWVPLEARKGH